MESIIEFIKEFSAVIVALLGTGGISGWFLKKLDFKREKKRLKAHLKSTLLDKILEQCRRLEKKLNDYPEVIKIYQNYLKNSEIDPETGYPKNIFDFEIEPRYIKYITELKEEKERLRHIHQDYVIKTKSEDLQTVKSIDQYLTNMINYKNENFNYDKAVKEHLAVLTDLRTIYHEIKENYPEEVPLNS